MSFNATVWVENGFVKVRWPYNRTRMNRLKDAIKDELPRDARRWSPEDKCLNIDPAYDAKLLEILEKHCDEVVIIGDTASDEAVERPAAHDGDPASRLIELCPDKALPKVWRTIAAALHPDAGGDAEVFKQANSAWEALRSSRGV